MTRDVVASLTFSRKTSLVWLISSRFSLSSFCCAVRLCSFSSCALRLRFFLVMMSVACFLASSMRLRTFFSSFSSRAIRFFSVSTSVWTSLVAFLVSSTTLVPLRDLDFEPSRLLLSLDLLALSLSISVPNQKYDQAALNRKSNPRQK